MDVILVNAASRNIEAIKPTIGDAGSFMASRIGYAAAGRSGIIILQPSS